MVYADDSEPRLKYIINEDPGLSQYPINTTLVEYDSSHQMNMLNCTSEPVFKDVYDIIPWTTLYI